MGRSFVIYFSQTSHLRPGDSAEGQTVLTVRGFVQAELESSDQARTYEVMLYPLQPPADTAGHDPMRQHLASAPDSAPDQSAGSFAHGEFAGKTYFLKINLSALPFNAQGYRLLAGKQMQGIPAIHSTGVLVFSHDDQNGVTRQGQATSDWLATGVPVDAFEYVLMDYFPGQRLDQWLSWRENNLTQRSRQIEQQIMTIVSQLVQIIRGFDAHGLVHGDLYFHNILIDPALQLRVIDFDTVKSIERLGTSPVTENVKRPPGLRLQQIDRLPIALLDFYALACMIYWLFLRGYQEDIFQPENYIFCDDFHITGHIGDPDFEQYSEYEFLIPQAVRICIHRTIHLIKYQRRGAIQSGDIIRLRNQLNQIWQAVPGPAYAPASALVAGKAAGYVAGPGQAAGYAAGYVAGPGQDAAFGQTTGHQDVAGAAAYDPAAAAANIPDSANAAAPAGVNVAASGVTTDPGAGAGMGAAADLSATGTGSGGRTSSAGTNGSTGSPKSRGRTNANDPTGKTGSNNSSTPARQMIQAVQAWFQTIYHAESRRLTHKKYLLTGNVFLLAVLTILTLTNGYALRSEIMTGGRSLGQALWSLLTVLAPLALLYVQRHELVRDRLLLRILCLVQLGLALLLLPVALIALPWSFSWLAPILALGFWLLYMLQLPLIGYMLFLAFSHRHEYDISLDWTVLFQLGLYSLGLLLLSRLR